MIRNAIIRRWMDGASAGNLTIFQYHKIPSLSPAFIHGEVEAAEFSRVLANYLEWFRFLPLDEAAERMQRGSLPRRAAAITFDDGYAEWFEHIVPLLSAHGLPATFFITSNQLGKKEPFWHERIAHAVAARSPGQLPAGFDWGIMRIGSRDEDIANTIVAVQEKLKYQPLAERAAAIEMLEDGIARNEAFRPFTAADIIRLRDAGFQIGGHSRNHPILSRCTAAEAQDEIGGCKEELEGILRQPVTQFAYPNGRPGIDFSADHVRLVRQAGYRLAVTTAAGIAQPGTDPLQLPRFTPWARSNWRSALQIVHNMRVKAETLPPREEVHVPAKPVGTSVASPAEVVPVISSAAKKTVLMVAFHFPPQAGSSGILRTLNFAKYLPGNGWSPIVLSAHPRAYEECRDDLLKSIPAETLVVRAFALDAARHLGIMRKYPSVLALPDRWSTWWFGGVLSGMREIRRAKPAVLWSTYPITSAHLIGATLAQLSGLPWVADFRDPMINGDYPSAPLQRKTWQWLESLVMRSATRCIYTTERAAEVYRQRYPAAAHKCQVIENGYDEEAFVGNEPSRAGVQNDQIFMLHSGIIYPRDRDPTAFFAAIEAMLESGKVDRQKLKVRFRAPHHGSEVAALASKHGLDDVVEIAPPIPYREAIAEMMGADLLLVFQGSHFNSQIPAKIYEYLRSGVPLLGLVDRKGDTATQLEKFAGVQLAQIDSVEEILESMQRCLLAMKGNDAATIREKNLQRVKSFSRASQTTNLAKVFSEVTG